MNFQINSWYVGSVVGDYLLVVPVARPVNGSFRAVIYQFDNRRAVFGTTRYMNVPDLRQTTPEEILKQFGKTEGKKAVTRIMARQAEIN